MGTTIYVYYIYYITIVIYIVTNTIVTIIIYILLTFLQLSCLFSKTFSNKIDSIIINIKNNMPTTNYPSIIVIPPISVFLSFFRPPYISLISKLLNASSSISPSDPVPLSIFKLYSDYICPTICNIISYSLNSGTVPSIFKQAIIAPILKKPSLDPESLLNYRPISQLHLVSKILERVVSSTNILFNRQ